MKTLSGTTRLIVLVALAIGSVAAIALAKEKGAPPPKYPFHVVFKEALCDKGVLNKALAKRPGDSHEIQYNDQPIGGGALPSPCPTAPPSSNKTHVNVTQQAAFATTSELRDFMKTVFR
jgi:hypothetical protein